MDKIDFKPDKIIILSHVIEHWSDFKNEIQKLINIQKKNETLNYIEFPGVTQLKKEEEKEMFWEIFIYPTFIILLVMFLRIL